jgi:hypothetical protein
MSIMITPNVIPVTTSNQKTFGKALVENRCAKNAQIWTRKASKPAGPIHLSLMLANASSRRSSPVRHGLETADATAFT